MKLDQNPLKKATLAVAFLFSCSAFSAKSENSKEIIEKSYALSLQKNRSQAVQVLVNSIRKEGKKSQAAKELMQALEEVSTVFYSEKAQQQFELALSLRMAEPQTALNRLNEASKLEPENLSILLELLRLEVALGDCTNALHSAQKLRESNPFFETLALINSQAAVCAGQFENYLQTKNAVDTRKSPHLAFWVATEIEYLFKSGSLQRARDLSQQLVHLDAKFPEGYFWQWKIETELKLKSDKMAQKYSSLCKTMTSKEARNYFAEPQLCRRLSEIETYLKKSNTSG